MCGIAGIIYRDGGGERKVGRDMTAMLQAMKHRGPDSTGYALYRPPAEGYVMHVKLADANTPRDFEFHDRLHRHRAEVERRLTAARLDLFLQIRCAPLARDHVVGQNLSQSRFVLRLQ